MKKEIQNLAKGIIKNHLNFRKMMFFEPNFREELQSLLNKYGDTTKTKSVIFSIVSGKEWTAGNYQSACESTSPKFIREQLKMFKGLSEKARSEIKASISRFLVEFNLGKEWEKTLLILITTGNFYVPCRNFYIGVNDRDKKRVTITVNPDTSLEEITMQWKIIKEFQKFLWPKFKKTNITKKTSRKIDTLFRTEMLRIIEADKENRAKLGFYEEKTLYDFFDIKKSEESIKRTETG